MLFRSDSAVPAWRTRRCRSVRGRRQAVSGNRRSAAGLTTDCGGCRRAPLASRAALGSPRTGCHLRLWRGRSVPICTHPYSSVPVAPTTGVRYTTSRRGSMDPGSLTACGAAAGIALPGAVSRPVPRRFSPASAGLLASVASARPTSVSPLDHARVRPGAMGDCVALFWALRALFFYFTRAASPIQSNRIAPINTNT